MTDKEKHTLIGEVCLSVLLHLNKKPHFLELLFIQDRYNNNNNAYQFENQPNDEFTAIF